MKLTSLLLIAVLWFATSCGSDDDDAVPDGAFNFSATIDGSGWEGAGNSRVDILPVVGAQTSIGAGNANGSAFALLFSGDATGTYDAADGFSGIYTDPNQTVFQSTSGSVNITKFTESQISGTFSFEATDQSGNTISVTNGSFTDVNVMR